ncbi:hypothetical protein J6590_052741 [Homalodisca vitripennis]|nr:hypothetical protein J6590_052741 [Homalodisca vitripennis]
MADMPVTREDVSQLSMSLLRTPSINKSTLCCNNDNPKPLAPSKADMPVTREDVSQLTMSLLRTPSINKSTLCCNNDNPKPR